MMRRTKTKPKILKVDALKKLYKEIKDEPVSEFVEKKLSPSRNHLRPSELAQPTDKQNQLYARSDKYEDSAKLMYEDYDDDLKNGGHANAGNYCNNLQAVGGVFKPTSAKKKKTKGNGLLYHKILQHKNQMCQYVVDELKEKGGTQYISVGFHNKYPCLMVYIKPTALVKNEETKKPRDAAFEALVSFYASFFVGLINHAAYVAKLPIEMERRSSFGFLVPTIAPTGKSFRINMGVVPQEYADLLVKKLKEFDAFLNAMIEKEFHLTAVPKDSFYFTKAYENYIDEKYEKIDLENIAEMLVMQVEKNGKTTVQNIDRTAYARDGVSHQVFEELLKEGSKIEDAFQTGIKWAIGRMKVVKNKLSFVPGNDIKYSVDFDFKSEPTIKDKSFWTVIEYLVERAEKFKNEVLNDVLSDIKNLCQQKKIANLYAKIEVLGELLFCTAIKTADDYEYGDGHGSDSEEENEIKGCSLFSKKIVTHNGMRSIWAALIAAVNYHDKHAKKGKSSVYLDRAYYEVELGWKLIAKIEKLSNLSLADNASEANILIYDLNACVTNGKKNNDYAITNSQIVILDNTSSTTECTKTHLERFAESSSPVLFFAASGLKHHQVGWDKNHYGLLHIFARSEKMRDDFYTRILAKEPAVLSKYSHRLRQMMKRLGAAPTTSYFVGGELKKDQSVEEKKTIKPKMGG